MRKRYLLITLMLAVLIIGAIETILALEASPSGQTNLTVQGCNSEDNVAGSHSFGSACQGTYPAPCGSGASNDRLSCNDNYNESHTMNGNNQFAGINITSFNSTITNCANVTEVKLCFEIWSSSTSLTACNISVDSNGGASFSTINTTCPGTTANPGVSCTNVTSLESWNCTNFFGATGVRALASSEVEANTGGAKTIFWDAFYFNVTYNIAPDTTPPVVNTTFNITSPNINDIMNFTGNVTDETGLLSANITYNVSGIITKVNFTLSGTSAQVSNATTLSSGAGSVINFTLYVTDTSNNVKQNSTLITVVDRIPPVVNTTFNITNPKINDIINFTANVTDETGLASANITYNISGVITKINFTLSGTSAQISNVTKLPSVGVINFTLYVTDTSNNVKQNSTLVTVIDNVPPVVNTSFNISNPVVNDIFNFTGNVTDETGLLSANWTYNLSGAITKINYTLSGTSAQVSNSTKLSSGGVINFTLYATDTSNNVKQNSTLVTVIDNVPPAVNTTFNITSPNINDIMNFTGNVTDETGLLSANITYNVSGIITKINFTLSGTSAQVSNATTLSGGAGSVINFTLYVTDTSNNVKQNSTLITIADRTFPIVNTTFNITSPVVNDIFNFTGNVTDETGLLSANWTYNLSGAITKINYSLSGTSAQVSNSTKLSSGGVINFTLYVTDTSNNVKQNSTLVTVIDNVPPVVNTTFNATSPSNADVINFTGNTTDETGLLSANITYNISGVITKVNFTLSGTSTQVSSVTSLSGIPGGSSINFTLYVTDTSNNVKQNSTLITVTDNTPPSVNTTFNKTSPVVGDVLNFTGNVTDETGLLSANWTYNISGSITKINYSLSGTSAQVSNVTIPFASGGVINFTLYVTDTSNNVKQNSTLVTVIDNVLPVVNTTFNTTAPTNRDFINFTGNITDETGLLSANWTVNLSAGTLKMNYSLSGLTAQVSNTTSLSGLPNGSVINFTLYITDTSNNLKQNSTVLVVSDATPPVVNTTFNITSPLISDILNFTANITDETGLLSANITYNMSGSLTKVNFTMSGTSAQVSNATKINSIRNSVINFTLYVTDTSNNVKQNSTLITVADTPAPQATIVFPTTDLKTNQQPLPLNVTFLADPDGDVINISYYINGRLNQTQFGNTTLNASDGIYILNVSLFDNVSGAASSANVTVNFTIDTAKPNTTLINPANNFNSSTQSIIFSFNVTDNIATQLNCSINLDANVNKTNSTTLNGTRTSFNSSNITEGFHNWNITCLDGAGNSNTSEMRNFTIDLTTPLINLVSYSPNSTDDVDPNVLLNFTINATDNLSSLKNVFLQYKQSGAGLFTNATSQFNSVTGLYYANFTPNIADTWNYRIYTEDFAGNNVSSNVSSISVQFDKTWKRVPSSFNNLACGLSLTCVVGNLTINNTGDFTMNFHISSNYTLTAFNATEPFDLAAKEYKVVQVSLTSVAIANQSDVGITTDATTANADPDFDTTNFTFVSSTGGPLFDLTLTASTLEVNRSAGTPFNLTAKLKNIGNETAGFTWVNYSLPDQWFNFSGYLNRNFSGIAVNEVVYQNITVNITSSAATGTQIANVSAASNNSAAKNASTSFVVTETSTSTTTTTTTTSGGGGGGGGGSGGGGGGGSTIEVPVKPEEIEISQTVDLLRGESNSFTVNVTNPFPDSTITDLTMTLEGFPSQYVTINPSRIGTLDYLQTSSFKVTLSAPSYKEYEEHTLKATVTGMIVKVVKIENITATSRNPFTLKNYISLFIHIATKESADLKLQDAEKLLEEMKNAGFSIKKPLKLLEEAKEKSNIKRYDLVENIIKQIREIRENSFAANNLINDIKSKIQEAEDKGLQVEETKKLLNLALAAFEREDFLTAIQRAKDAQLSIVIETKGKFNVTKLVIDNWYPIILVLLILLSFSYFIRKQLTLIIISRRLEDLQKEEVTLNELMQETQEKYYKEKKINTTEYHKAMYGYEKRLGEVSQLISRLRSKRVGIIEISNEIKNLKKEDQNVIDLIKQLQDGHYNKKIITEKVYLKRIEEYKTRRIEIERSIAVLDAKIAKKEKLEELNAKKNPKKKISEAIKKEEEKFRKPPLEAKPKKKFSFWNIFRKKEDPESVKKILDEIIKNKEKRTLLLPKQAPVQHNGQETIKENILPTDEKTKPKIPPLKEFKFKKNNSKPHGYKKPVPAIVKYKSHKKRQH